MSLRNKSKFHIYLDSDTFWEYLENGRDVDDLYPEHFKTEITDAKYHDVMKSLIDEDEKYILLDEECDGYAITSKGKAYNCSLGNQIHVYISKHDLQIIIRKVKLNMSEVFAEQGWDFDLKKIKKQYEQNKWKQR